MSEKSWPKWLPLRSDLADLSPYGAPQLNVAVRLNTNENPYALSEELQLAIEGAVSSVLKDLNRYPDRDAIALRKELANFINRKYGSDFDTDWIWAANGSNEIIQSILLAFEGDALGFEPSYSMHPLIAKVVGRNWTSISRNEDFEIGINEVNRALSLKGVKVFFVTTPNNPTGNTTPLAVIEALAQGAWEQGALVVIDEAYAEFSPQPSAITLIKRFPNILVSRTMSKAFAFAGARLGYLIADPKVIEALLLVRLPYHLSAITQAAALAALNREAVLDSDVVQIRSARDQLSREIEALGLRVIPSDANFILFGGLPRDTHEIWEELLERGILVRELGIPGFLRVTVGSRSENQLFLDALQEVVRG